MNAHRIYQVVWPLLVALLLVWMVRMFCLGEVRIGADTCPPDLQQGDYVIFNRWSYGYRAEMSDSIVRFGSCNPSKGDIVAVRPQTITSAALCVGRVLAHPGDTVWMGYGGVVAPCRMYEKGCIWPVRVPAHGSIIAVKPWNAALYAQLIRTYEGDSTAIVRDTALCLQGHDVKQYRFKRDYYWISSGSDANIFDSRTYGPVPHASFVGRLTFVLFANDRRRWMHCITY